MTTEAETRVTPPQSEKGLGPPELDETRKAAPLETEEVRDFRPPELRDNGFLLFSVPAPPPPPQVCATLLPKKLMQQWNETVTSTQTALRGVILTSLPDTGVILTSCET